MKQPNSSSHGDVSKTSLVLVQVPQRNLASQFQYKQLGVSLRSGSWVFSTWHGARTISGGSGVSIAGITSVADVAGKMRL